MVRIFFPSKQSYKPLQELYPRYYQIGPYSCSWAGAPAHWALYGPFDPLVHFTGPVGIHVTAPRDRHDSYHSIPSAAARRPHGITQKAKQQRDQWWSRGRAGEAVEGEKKKKNSSCGEKTRPETTFTIRTRPAGRPPANLPTRHGHPCSAHKQASWLSKPRARTSIETWTGRNLSVTLRGPSPGAC
jgi:hypothetical protein